MPTTVKLKNSVTTTNAPSSLQQGEVAINITDKKVWVGNAATTPVQLLGDGASGTFGALTVTSLTDSGNLTFTGTGNRILGDFSNATQTNRVAFQTSTTNENTVVTAIPNGTAVVSLFRAFNNSDPTNAAFVHMVATGTETQINSGITGTGTYLPLIMLTNGSERLRIATDGNVGIGTNNPAYQLHISGTAPRIEMTDTDTGASSYISASSANGSLVLAADESNVSASSVMAFRVDATERMRINSSGFVGIGTTNPSTTLQAVGVIYSSTGGFALGDGTSFTPSGLNAIPNYGIGYITSSGSTSISSFNNLACYAGQALVMNVTQAGLLQFNSGYGSVATAYGCRAWVNFDGIGTVSIRASGNVSSITDNGTGLYTVNLTNSMPDSGGAAVASSAIANFPDAWGGDTLNARITSVSSVELINTAGAARDVAIASLAVFR